MKIRLSLIRTEDGVRQVEITQLTPPLKSKRDILNGVYCSFFAKKDMSLEEFAEFYSEVMATELSDEGLAPTIDVCQDCGDHLSITTYAGKTHEVRSFENLVLTLTHLVTHSLITSDEATMIEAQARKEVVKMPEKESDTPPLFSMFDELIELVNKHGR